MNTIIDGTNTINASQITFPPIKVLANGGKIVNVRNSAANNAFRMSTPLMLTWGASDYEGNEKFELSLQFPNSDNKSAATNTFLKNMKMPNLFGVKKSQKTWGLMGLLREE